MKADFTRWASAPPSWVAASDVGPAVSSRVRVARNLAGVPFPHNAAPASRRQVLQQVFAALKPCPLLERAQAFPLTASSALDRAFLMERQLMSHQHAEDDGDHGLVVAPGESLSILVNEEDHVRAAAFRSGIDLAGAWEALVLLDDELSRRLPLAFDSEFGFVTSCPTNLGTGLRASTLLHLPALVLTGRIQAILESLTRAGLTARGFYGEGTSSVGDLIQISNTHTLGQSEAATVKSVEKSVRQILALEAKAAVELMGSDLRTGLEDRIYRASGTLGTARLLDYTEGMRCLSLLRFGLRLGLPLDVSPHAVNRLMFLTQPAHLKLRAPKTAANESAVRADLVRERLRRGGEGGGGRL